MLVSDLMYKNCNVGVIVIVGSAQKDLCVILFLLPISIILFFQLP